MYSASINKSLQLFLFAVFALIGSIGQCQEEGSDDLDKAFDLKIKAQSTKDLDEVAKLCKSAIEKGLDEEGIAQAKELAASALFEYADQLGQRIFASRGEDRRWRVYRSQAIRRLEEATELQPDMIPAYLMIARLNTLPGGDLDKAREAVDSAIELADDEQDKSKALYMRATLTEDDEQELADLNKAIEIDPNNMDAIRVRGAYYLRNDDTEKAIADINSWLEGGDPNTVKYIDVARSLMSMGEKFDEKLQQAAMEIIDKAIVHDPENPMPHTVRAQINILRDQLDDAAEDLGRAIKIDEDNIGVRLLRASIYSDQQKLDEALEDINSVLELEPLLVQGIQMRGTILSQQEKFGEAIEDFRLLSDNEPDNQFLKRQLAMLYNADNRPTRAIKIYDDLLEINSKDEWEGKSNSKKLVFVARRAAVLRGRGDARLSTGEHQKAVEDYNEALELGKLIEEIEKEEGVEEPTKADDGVLNNLAWVLATSPMDEVRDGKRAIELATLAAEVTEFKEPHILSTLASGYAEAGDWDNAIKWIQKGIELNAELGKTDDSKRIAEQRESLQKEYESYQRKEPWRELQNVEEEQKQKKLDQEKKSAEQAGEDDKDSDDDKDNDSDDDKDKDDDKNKDDDKDKD